jgi:hypothetical protein
VGEKAMLFTTLKISGADAIRLLNQHRSRFGATGQYPFLIGDREALGRFEEAEEFNPDDSATIIQTSQKVSVPNWIAKQEELEDDAFALDEIAGDWPYEIPAPRSVSVHRDVLTGKLKPEVYLGLATIVAPWHLPAVVKFGNWNACPDPAVHCAFHRSWQDRFGAEIVGCSGDVIECLVKSPPTDRKTATALAWEQYWYCTDIVYQGCESVANLAATLLDSRYWYFWWD